MQVTVTLLFAAFFVPATLATVHTQCFEYFKTTQGCVYSAADDSLRCPADRKQCIGATPLFTLQTSKPKSKRSVEQTLDRRYDTTGVFPVAGGTGICGAYDTNRDEGACLWAGTSSSGAHPSTAGWLNGAKTSNCGKRVYIQRTGQPNSVIYAPVKDGCTFNTFKVNIGCFQIALTNRTFYALKPTPQEIAAQAINGITWDFDNLNGQHSSQGPV